MQIELKQQTYAYEQKNCIKWVSWLIFVIIAIVITFIYVCVYTRINTYRQI